MKELQRKRSACLEPVLILPMPWWSYRLEAFTVMREYLMRIIFIILLADRRGADNESEKVFVDSEKLGCSSLLLVQSNEFNESITKYTFFCSHILQSNLNYAFWPLAIMAKSESIRTSPI